MNRISINKHHNTPVIKKLQPNFKNNFEIAYFKEKCNYIFGLRTKIIQQGPLREKRYLVSKTLVEPGDSPSIRTSTFYSARDLCPMCHETSRYIKYLINHNLIFLSKDIKGDYENKRYITHHNSYVSFYKEVISENNKIVDKLDKKSSFEINIIPPMGGRA